MIRFATAFAVALAAAVPPVAAAVPLGGDAAACESNKPAILATVTGIKDRSGTVRLELYPPTDEDFTRDDHALIAEGKTFRRIVAAAPAGGTALMCIRVPRPGRYALLFTHNRDGKNKFNIWADGAGIVSNSKIGRGKPKADQSLVDVGNSVTALTIRAQYLHGFGGFSPSN